MHGYTKRERKRERHKKHTKHGRKKELANRRRISSVVYYYLKNIYFLLISVVIGRIPIRRGHLRLVIFIVKHRRNRCSFSPNHISFRRSRNASNKVSNHPRPLLGILQCLRHVHFAVRNQFFQLLRALHWVRLIAAIPRQEQTRHFRHDVGNLLRRR